MPTEKPSEHQIDPGEPAQNKPRSRLLRLRRKTDDAERKKQLQDYLAWVNNYLKRRPGVQPIVDMRTGLQDGIALVNLVEIAANAEIPFVERSPSSLAQRKANLQKAISFLTSDGVHLQGDPVKDIMDGSVKGVLRVILAIAEKYNPRSVRRIPTAPQATPRERSSTDPLRASGPERPVVHDLPSSLPQTQSPLATNSIAMTNLPTAGVSLSQGGFGMASYSQSAGFIHNLSLSQGAGLSLSQPAGAGESIYSTPVDSLPENVVQRISSQMPPHRLIGQRNLKSGARPRATSPKPHLPPVREGEEEEVCVGPMHELSSLMKQLGAFKSELLELHCLLLENGGGETGSLGVVDIRLPLEMANADLLAKEKEMAELRESVMLLREQLEKWEGECETLQGMVRERNQFITSMKSEIYRKEYRNDTERVDLQTQIIQKDKMIAALETDLGLLKEELEGKEKERARLKEESSQQQLVEDDLRQEMERVRAELSRATIAEETLHAKLSARDKKLTLLEEKLSEGEVRGRRIDPSTYSQDMDSIREQLGVLRGSLMATDPQQKMLDDLEKSISEMMAKIRERARSSSPSKKERGRRHYDQRERRRHKERERLGSISKEEAGSVPVATPTEGTKVFYYLTGDRSETPYVTTVARKMSEVRLRDFRAVFDRQGTFRFYFKTEDPDCGVVREEITDDDHLLPCWNGKIIVWVSEKGHHHHR